MSGDASPGGWVQRRRRGLGLTQDQLAVQIAISVHTLRKIENDERRPSPQVAHLLAEALQIPAGERAAFILAARGEGLVEKLGSPVAVDDAAVSPELREPLPRLREPLIGREGDLAELRQWLSAEQPQVVTITGLGGVGKTHLALAAAHDVAERFADGGAFVSLAGITTGEWVPQTIARALSLNIAGRAAPRVQLGNWLRRQHLLLVLDNTEHLLRESGGESFIATVTTICERAPQVKLLVTSREPLNVAGEWVFGLRGLSLADEDGSAAAALFLRHMRRARLNPELSADDRSAIVEICRAVAGLPLAIELAASWARVLSPRQIAEQLRRDADFMQSQRRDLPPRQRSLRATFEHSWRLLDAEEQRVLGQLSLFQGGFSPEAAAQVAGATIAQLAGLSDKSLVERRDGQRFELHELVRQFASERLQEDESAARLTRNRHARFYLDLLDVRGRELMGHRPLEALNALTPDLDNLRSAWDWALASEQFELLQSAPIEIYFLHQLLGTFREGRVQGQHAVEAITRAIVRDGPLPLLQRELGLFTTLRGIMSFRLGNVGELAQDTERGLALLEPLGDDLDSTFVLSMATIEPNITGKLDLARDRLERARAIAATLQAEWWLMMLDGQIGINEMQRGQLPQAYERFRDVVARARAMGDVTFIGIVAAFLCRVCMTLGKFAEARAVAEDCIPLLRRTGDRYGLASLYIELAAVHLQQGDAAAALKTARMAHDLSDDTASSEGIIESMNVEGQALAALGETAAGKHTLIEAVRLAMAMNAVQFALSALCSLAVVSVADDPRAWGWLALVQSHPASHAIARARAAALLTARAPAQATHQSPLDLDQVVQAL